MRVDNLAQEVTKGLREKWERGGVVGNPPYGYRRVFELDSRGERIRATNTLHPTDDAAVLLTIYQRYATGSYSAAGLTEALNAEGHTHTGARGARVPITIDAVRGILACPTYAGLTAYKGETRPARHAAIVTPELWARVEELRARRADGHVGKSAAKTKSLLSELAYCAHCGEKPYYHPTGGGIYYRCKARRQRERAACAAPMVSLASIDGHLQERLSTLSIPEDMACDAIDDAESLLARPTRPPAVSADQIRERLRRLHRAYVAGGLTDAEYDAERGGLESLLAPSPPTQQAVRLDMERAAALLRDAGSVYADSPLVERRGLLLTVFERLWLEPHQIAAITPKPAYALLIEAQAGFLENPTLIGLEAGLSIIPLPPIWDEFHVAS